MLDTFSAPPLTSVSLSATNPPGAAERLASCDTPSTAPSTVVLPVKVVLTPLSVITAGVAGLPLVATVMFPEPVGPGLLSPSPGFRTVEIRWSTVSPGSIAFGSAVGSAVGSHARASAA